MRGCWEVDAANGNLHLFGELCPVCPGLSVGICIIYFDLAISDLFPLTLGQLEAQDSWHERNQTTGKCTLKKGSKRKIDLSTMQHSGKKKIWLVNILRLRTNCHRDTSSEMLLRSLQAFLALHGLVSWTLLHRSEKTP
jgi:hypothetical protein